MKKIVFLLFCISLFSCGGEQLTGVRKHNADEPEIGLKKDTGTVSIPVDSSLIVRDSIDSKVFENNPLQSVRSAKGVEVEFVERGTGSSIQKGDVVTIKYKGKLPDGKVFDSSDMIGMPLAFYVGIGMSVKGWDEALPLMKVGDKARVKIPSKLGYGKKGYGKLIAPDTDLLFDMEVVEKLEPKKTSTGLIFYLTLAKEGPNVIDGQTVSMHFYGWLESGKLFDSSHMSGNPHEFVMGKGKSLPAWDEALKMMSKGDKAIIVAPPALAYGENGIPELVPSNATLIYNIELLDVK